MEEKTVGTVGTVQGCDRKHIAYNISTVPQGWDTHGTPERRSCRKYD